LPANDEQQAVMAALRQGASGPFNVERIERTFRAGLASNGFRPDAYDDYLKALPSMLQPPRPVTLHDLEAAGLDRFVRRYVHREDGGTWPSVTYIFPTAADAKRRAPPALVKALDRPQDGIEITGVNIASGELRRIFKRDAWR